MLKLLSLLCCATCLLLSTASVQATTLVDVLHKRFKKISYPNDEITAQIAIHTEVPAIAGEKTEDTVRLAYQTHTKLVATFIQGGWNSENTLESANVDAGLIELELDKGMNFKLRETLRLKAFVHQCDFPMFKYRGGRIEKFFQKQVLEKAEQCFTYDEHLQGKNYPY